jgi:hypothetical protein
MEAVPCADSSQGSSFLQAAVSSRRASPRRRPVRPRRRLPRLLRRRRRRPRPRPWRLRYPRPGRPAALGQAIGRSGASHGRDVHDRPSCALEQIELAGLPPPGPPVPAREFDNRSSGPRQGQRRVAVAGEKQAILPSARGQAQDRNRPHFQTVTARARQRDVRALVKLRRGRRRFRIKRRWARRSSSGMGLCHAPVARGTAGKVHGIAANWGISATGP